MARFVLLVILLIVIISCKTSKHEGAVSKPGSGWYSVRFLPLCKGKEGEVDFDTLVKYGTNHPYNIVTTMTADSAVISFEFLEDCCLTFSGRAAVVQDTLVLKFGLDRAYTESCGCWCEYGLIYRIEKGARRWNEVKIIREQMM